MAHEEEQQLRDGSRLVHSNRIPKDHSWFVAAGAHEWHRMTDAGAGSNDGANRSLVVRCVVVMDGPEGRDTRSRMLNQMDQCLRGRRAANRLPRRRANRRTPARCIGGSLDGKALPLLLNSWLNWRYRLDEGSEGVRICFYERGNDRVSIKVVSRAAWTDMGLMRSSLGRILKPTRG
jgi:hypothetical protein